MIPQISGTGTAMQIKRTLGHMAPNYFGSSAQAMAAWNSASHVEVINPNPTPPTPVPVGGGPTPEPPTP